METIYKTAPEKPAGKNLVQGTVLAKNRRAVFIDIPPFGTGIIFGREYKNARDIIKEINPGDNITAKVVTPEGEDGYIELSLKEAKQALLWSEAKQAVEANSIFELPVKSANKGGLLIEWQGIDGFLPASQLNPDHYPKVPDGNKEKIMEELKKLVGQNLKVYMINVNPRENKLIFSEKKLASKSRKEIVSKYNLGDIVAGEVTGVVDFGLFVKIEEGFEGLVHLSEIDWALVENPRDLYKVGDRVETRIIDIKEDKISLSIKALKKNPWLEAAKKYQKGARVEGVVIKYNRHGALVSIEEGVAGLVHVSEFGGEEAVRQQLELGRTYPFTITLFDPTNQRLILSFLNGPATNVPPVLGTKETKSPPGAVEPSETKPLNA